MGGDIDDDTVGSDIKSLRDYIRKQRNENASLGTSIEVPRAGIGGAMAGLVGGQTRGQFLAPSRVAEIEAERRKKIAALEAEAFRRLPTHCATCRDELRVGRAVSGYTTCGDACERALAVSKRLQEAK